MCLGGELFNVVELFDVAFVAKGRDIFLFILLICDIYIYIFDVAGLFVVAFVARGRDIFFYI